MTDKLNKPTTKAYIITGPTSGIGYLTALELAKRGTVVLVGRDRKKLEQVQRTLQANGHNAELIECDLSDIVQVKLAAQQILSLQLPLAGLINNAGIFPVNPSKNAQGWDRSYTTNHLGSFVLTEALAPHLPNNAQVLFIASGVEDPERKPAKGAGFRGGRYISAEASAKGEWLAGGSTKPGFDAYATTKQCQLASVFVFAREYPNLRINAVEPGFCPGSNLGRDANAVLHFIAKYILSPLAPHINYWSTPEIASKMIAKVVTETTQTGQYFDEKGQPMLASKQMQDTQFQNRVVAETREFLSKFKG
jgi:NAD(P)-dependent dehydrogenase (short-subunit alcohol dehydrogenase family)